MAEYNLQYNTLRKRLNILKLLNNSEITSKIIDSLLKELDERYSENLPLCVVESKLEKINA